MPPHSKTLQHSATVITKSWSALPTTKYVYTKCVHNINKQTRKPEKIANDKLLKLVRKKYSPDVTDNSENISPYQKFFKHKSVIITSEITWLPLKNNKTYTILNLIFPAFTNLLHSKKLMDD